MPYKWPSVELRVGNGEIQKGFVGNDERIFFLALQLAYMEVLDKKFVFMSSQSDDDDCFPKKEPDAGSVDEMH